MCACSCGCQSKGEKKDNLGVEKKNYLCYQCNTFKEAPASGPAPECCGKKMEAMD